MNKPNLRAIQPNGTFPTPTFPAYASIPDWCRYSGVGRSSTYEALGRGDLRAVKLGSKTLIDVAHGLSWVNSLPMATVRPHGASHRAKQTA